MSYGSKSLNELAQECHKTAVDHGFWDYPTPLKHMIYAVKIALIHSEATEALQELRKASPQLDPDNKYWSNFGDELVDIIIRILDLADDAGVDLDTRIATIMERNRNRPHMHGKTL